MTDRWMTDRQMDTDSQIDRLKVRQKGRQTDRRTDRYMGTQTDELTERQTDVSRSPAGL